MGLDQYLSKKTYIGASYEHNEVEGTVDIKKKGKELDIPLNKIRYIELHACYWRKANQIHGWFVENVQEGVDNCGEYSVDIDDLKELLDLCKQVMSNPKDAPKILPCEEGFFFGSQDYGDSYFRDIEDTISMLEDVVANHGDYDTYYYSSSW